MRTVANISSSDSALEVLGKILIAVCFKNLSSQTLQNEGLRAVFITVLKIKVTGIEGYYSAEIM